MLCHCLAGHPSHCHDVISVCQRREKLQCDVRVARIGIRRRGKVCAWHCEQILSRHLTVVCHQQHIAFCDRALLTHEGCEIAGGPHARVQREVALDRRRAQTHADASVSQPNLERASPFDAQFPSPGSLRCFTRKFARDLACRMERVLRLQVDLQGESLQYVTRLAVIRRPCCLVPEPIFGLHPALFQPQLHVHGIAAVYHGPATLQSVVHKDIKHGINKNGRARPNLDHLAADCVLILAGLHDRSWSMSDRNLPARRQCPRWSFDSGGNVGLAQYSRFSKLSKHVCVPCALLLFFVPDPQAYARSHLLDHKRVGDVLPSLIRKSHQNNQLVSRPDGICNDQRALLAGEARSEQLKL
mmetsp:Transcript_30401/g.73094  ORF Transcript_30401/g.73094 Transcript_30401/m.73094 type:complete len:357 (-) Transcript_30401:1141-2211(-)